MGILDSMFGGGQGQDQSQGPQSPGILSRMQAQYAPGAYAAQQQSLQQQAIYSAMLQNGARPEQAQALAMSPQFFQSGQGAYMPQGPQVQTYTNSDNAQIPVQIQNPGGRAGHGLSLSGIPLIAPGTTASPEQAAGGGATPGAEQSGNAPAGSAGPTNTLQGMPGSNAQILQMIDKAQAQGTPAEEVLKVVPREYRDLTQAVLDGRMTFKELTQNKSDTTRKVVSRLVNAIDPEFDENMNEARQGYRKQYVSGKATDIGGQVKSLNKLAGHANAMADAAEAMNNYGVGGVAAIAHPLNRIGNQLNSTPAKYSH